MAYSELIKNFDKVRAYMREFNVYRFKSRCEYDVQKCRLYDERRRLESWLGDYMRFILTKLSKILCSNEISLFLLKCISQSFYHVFKSPEIY